MNAKRGIPPGRGLIGRDECDVYLERGGRDRLIGYGDKPLISIVSLVLIAQRITEAFRIMLVSH